MEKSKVRNGSVYIIEAHLQKLDNQLPYFSVTHEIWKANKKGEIDKRHKEPFSCGACHDEVEKAFPELWKSKQKKNYRSTLIRIIFMQNGSIKQKHSLKSTILNK